VGKSTTFLIRPNISSKKINNISLSLVLLTLTSILFFIHPLKS
jgi:hypothetical protein